MSKNGLALNLYSWINLERTHIFFFFALHILFFKKAIGQISWSHPHTNNDHTSLPMEVQDDSNSVGFAVELQAAGQWGTGLALPRGTQVQVQGLRIFPSPSEPLLGTEPGISRRCCPQVQMGESRHRAMSWSAHRHPTVRRGSWDRLWPGDSGVGDTFITGFGWTNNCSEPQFP